MLSMTNTIVCYSHKNDLATKFELLCILHVSMLASVCLKRAKWYVIFCFNLENMVSTVIGLYKLNTGTNISIGLFIKNDFEQSLLIVAVDIDHVFS